MSDIRVKVSSVNKMLVKLSLVGFELKFEGEIEVISNKFDETNPDTQYSGLEEKTQRFVGQLHEVEAIDTIILVDSQTVYCLIVGGTAEDEDIREDLKDFINLAVSEFMDVVSFDLDEEKTR